ncbi:hypothetical protein [Marinobacter sp. bablab_jr008]|uniref:hypothetical protein n=1 Tax=Marinobacter sp. bablab_jr008 TaxID=2755064 RepID=UPI0018F1BBE7|nr:hypothetical protein [Marinobacter sp. bablab_jr008]
MGSSSRSKTSSTESSQTLADNRVVDGDNAIIGGNITLSNTGSGSGQFNVTTTDFGALDAASEIAGQSFKFSDRALTSVDNSVEAVRTIAGDAGATISGALAKVTDFAASQQPDQKEAKTLQLIVIAVAVVGAVYVYRGGR